MVENWTERKRPLRLERRIEFDNYELTRDFLDLTGELSEREGFYPDLNFGRTHVNMTIHVEEGESTLKEAQLRFAQEVNVFAPTNQVGKHLDVEYSSEEAKK